MEIYYEHMNIGCPMEDVLAKAGKTNALMLNWTIGTSLCFNSQEKYPGWYKESLSLTNYVLLFILIVLVKKQNMWLF